MADLIDTTSTTNLTRGEAIALGLIHYSKGRVCKRGHLPIRRLVSNSGCARCAVDRARAWANANPDRFEEMQRKSAARPECRETNRVASGRVRLRNPRKSQEWKMANPDKVRVWRAEYQPQHRAHKLNATPEWADIGAIKAIYNECIRISDEIGIMHHVDHIVPLKGKTVCGLHVHYNLRILVWHENIAKGNKLIDIYMRDAA